MKIISLFNNKGGVGKTTLAFHLSHILANMGHKTLMIDLDPQCNLTICAMNEEQLHEIWKEEDEFIEDFGSARKKIGEQEFSKIINKPRTIHFQLKPTEDGLDGLKELPPPVVINKNLNLIPGRLTIHKFENKISERWSATYQGDPLAIRTITDIRSIAEKYAEIYGYEFIVIDTSPSLGILNKVIISTVDGFLIPASPDMFSLYGIRNIGGALTQWKKEFMTMYTLISKEKRSKFPSSFVRFLGYTIYNAKKYTGKSNNAWDLAQAHFNYAQEIPSTINQYITEEIRGHLSLDQVKDPIGGTAVMHSHNTMSGSAQKYNQPIWGIPGANLDAEDRSTISGNQARYTETKDKYLHFAEDFLERVKTLN
ncbi:MAG: ParA family protein [Candidatus Gracilibacteria bacterium]|nr:ParA family protein [Candidatus Gracilibacteria bacterium]